MAEVGVVIPLHDHARVVERALRSVLSQTMSELIVVVVDDGSTDGGAEKVAGIGDARVRIVGTGRLGPGAARNLGASLHDTRWLAFLDADDEWDARFLERATAAARAHPRAAAVFSAFRVEGGEGSGAGVPEGIVADYFRAQLVEHVAMTCSSVLIDRALFSALGGFESGLYYAEDICFWVRLACASALYFIPERLATIHRSPDPARPRSSLEERVRGLERVLSVHRELETSGRIPADRRRYLSLFMNNLEALRAVQLIKLGRRAEAVYALSVRARPTRFNWRLYVEGVRELGTRAARA